MAEWVDDEVSNWPWWRQRDTGLVSWLKSYRVGCWHECLGIYDDGRMPLESA